MESDQELLRRYAETGDETAFKEVVCRYTNLVYTAALRLTASDTYISQDVAQQVFTAMANKAAALSRHASLAGWLHTTTRYAASMAVRSERRRTNREQEASTMEHQPTTTEADWMQLEPLLDEAVGQLRATDREAVLLRYFQGKSHREIALALGWNESLAQKRVERALEQLRAHFTRRGVTVSSVVLATSMTANSVQAAPVGLGPSLAKASLAGAVKTSVFGAFLKGISISMRTKTTLAVIAMGGLVAAPILESRQISQTESRNADLATQNAGLQAQINRLGTRLRKITALMSDPALKASANPNDYLPVSKETIAGLPFGPMPGPKLDARTIGLLAMTPGEASQVQDTLTSLRNRIDAHQRASVRAVTTTDITDTFGLKFMQNAQKGNSYKRSFFEIPPLSPDELLAQRQWLSESFNKTLGDERGGILFQKMLEYDSMREFWLTPNTTKIYAFKYPVIDSNQSEIKKTTGPKSLGEYTTYHGQDGAIVGTLLDSPQPNVGDTSFIKTLYNSGRDNAGGLPTDVTGQANNPQATP